MPLGATARLNFLASGRGLTHCQNRITGRGGDACAPCVSNGWAARRAGTIGRPQQAREKSTRLRHSRSSFRFPCPGHSCKIARTVIALPCADVHGDLSGGSLAAVGSHPPRHGLLRPQRQKHTATGAEKPHPSIAARLLASGTTVPQFVGRSNLLGQRGDIDRLLERALVAPCLYRNRRPHIATECHAAVE